MILTLINTRLIFFASVIRNPSFIIVVIFISIEIRDLLTVT